MRTARYSGLQSLSEQDQLRLASSMGFASWDEFNQELLHHRTRVHEHFEQVFAAPQSDTPSDDTQVLTPLWLEEMETEEITIISNS